MAYRAVIMVFQIIVNRTAKSRERTHKRVNILLYPIILTLSFQHQQFLVASIKILGNPLVICLHRSFKLQKVFLTKRRTIHAPAPFHEIMRLVNEKNIFPFHPFREKSLQIHMRIKHIVIIAYHGVREQTHIQTHFKWAHTMFLSVFLDHISAVHVFMREQIVYCTVNSVIVSFGVGAVFRITLRLVHKADLILRRQYHTLEFKPAFPQQRKRIVGYRTRNRLSRQIENLLTHPFSHSLNRRENRGNCLSDSRRRLYKELTLMVNCLIDICHQLLLSLSIVKGKLQHFDGSLPYLLPCKGIVRPLAILLHNIRKPLFKLLKDKIVVEVSYFFCFHMTIRHADTNFAQSILLCVDISIAFCLRQMHRYGRLHLLNITENSLDFIYRNGIFLRNNTVSTPLHDNIVLPCIIGVLKPYLRLIFRTHTPLYHTVDSAAFLHCILG